MSLLHPGMVYTSWIIIKFWNTILRSVADVTVVCTDCEAGTDISRFGVLKMNEDHRIEEFDEKPMISTSKHNIYGHLYHQKASADRDD